MTDSMLIMESVSKSFAGLKALTNVTLSIGSDDIVGLIGPNGSGKTTLVNIVTGVIALDSGRVQINRVDITGWEPHKISRLGISRTFQTGRLFGALSARENVELGVIRTSERSIDHQVAKLLERLGLVPWAAADASSLPYGIQRRVEIARALGTRPNFLLLDEPAGGLNEEESDELLSVIRDIHQDPEIGCGVLIIDHDLRLIMRLCNRIHVLNEGKTIAEGTPQEIRKHPQVIQAYMGRKHDSHIEPNMESMHKDEKTDSKNVDRTGSTCVDPDITS